MPVFVVVVVLLLLLLLQVAGHKNLARLDKGRRGRNMEQGSGVLCWAGCGALRLGWKNRQACVTETGLRATSGGLGGFWGWRCNVLGARLDCGRRSAGGRL
jgi:hypothetical protein